MAKRGRGSRLDSAATAIGGALGRVAARVQKLERQRGAIAAELRHVISTAQEMLDDLGDQAVIARRQARRAVRKVTRRRKRRLSAQGRANIIAATRKRWMRVRRAKAAKSSGR